MPTSREIEFLDGIARNLRTHGVNSIGWAVAKGPRHTIRAEVRRMEKRGEVAPLWQHSVLDERSGVLQIPYLRLREHSAVRREHMIRWTAFWVGVAMCLAGVLYALWTIRIFILVTLVCAGVAVLVLRFLPHLSRGCSGIHCSGCRG